MTVGIEERRIVLRFKDVVLMAYHKDSTEILEVNMKLLGGELALFLLDDLQRASLFADACAGLVHPTKGTTYFLGKDWSQLSPDTANALRGRIGRVLTTGNWLNQLSLLENILLPQLHHTLSSIDDLRSEAVQLAKKLGLPGVPIGAPRDFITTDLQRAAYIRAFLGHPSLVLLENVTAGACSEMISALINVIRNARDHGAAVIWFTPEEGIWRDQSIPTTYRYRLVGHKLMELTK